MEMELDFIFNWINFELFVKMTKIGGLLKWKEPISRLDWKFLRKEKKKLETKLKVPFEIRNWTTLVWTYKYAQDIMTFKRKWLLFFVQPQWLA
jgi:hypothetical protein